MKSHIISIGNELLIGDTINTNASWLGRFLTEHGVEVTAVLTVGDNLNHLKSVLQQSLAEADLVITTGGLGPTHDDVTKKAVSELYETGMVLHEPTLEYIKKVFKKRNIPFSKSNYLQAEVPDNCEVLFNKQGTAPGMWFRHGAARLAVLPGVPHEMRHLMEHKVLDKIREFEEGEQKRLSRFIVTAGIGESTLSDEVIGEELGHFFSNSLSVAFLPNVFGTKIRISAAGETYDDIKSKIEPVAQFIYSKASDHIIGEGKELTIAEALGNLLRERSLTIGVAESCTGGLVSDTLTDVAGSSDYFKGGIIAYANEVKTELLGVRDEMLKKKGAVSRKAALQMARGVAERLQTDVGLATTGIAGPGGGTSQKPVGTVWLGCYTPDYHFAIKAVFTKNRRINKERSAATVLEAARRALKGIKTMPYGLKPYFD